MNNTIIQSNSISLFLKPQSYDAFNQAKEFCAQLKTKANEVITTFLDEHHFEQKDICVVCVGSVARGEALAASDLDIIPILEESAYHKFAEASADKSSLDTLLRERLREQLEIKVSKGEDLTKSTALTSLTELSSIGGDKDSSAILTKRMLILTEGCALGGQLPWEEIASKILDSYASCERTSGRHVLSLCNDISRYYRTLFIEYKAKIDTESKSWPVRNMKLRHSRKIWYLSSMLSVVCLASRCPTGDARYRTDLLEAFSYPPMERLFTVVDSKHHIAIGRIIDCFTWFLMFIAEPVHRERLDKVQYQDRDAILVEGADNPFKSLKLNSNLMHREILELIDNLDTAVRRRIMDWFLF